MPIGLMRLICQLNFQDARSGRPAIVALVVAVISVVVSIILAFRP